MAEAIRKENVALLANTNTLTGPAIFELVLAAGSDAAALTLTVDSSVIMTLKAPTADTASSPCLRLGAGIEATVALTGTAALAYAVFEVE